MIATTSAILWPGMMWGRTARLQNEAPRHLRRYGFGPPPAAREPPRPPRAPSPRAYPSPLGTRTCPTDFTPGREEIGPSGRPSRAWRAIATDSGDSPLRPRHGDAE